MKSLTKTELKRVAQYGLRVVYGFTVSKLSDIVLLEADGDGSYVMFEVNGHIYQVEKKRIWIGNGQSEDKYTVNVIEED